MRFHDGQTWNPTLIETRDADLPRSLSRFIISLVSLAVGQSVRDQNTMRSFLASSFSASTPGTFLRSSMDLNLPFLVR